MHTYNSQNLTAADPVCVWEGGAEEVIKNGEKVARVQANVCITF